MTLSIATGETDLPLLHETISANLDAVEQLDHRIGRGDTLHLICALSGG